jgi:Raf kinase inhibitor-like YbhB/YbcL family protein
MIGVVLAAAFSISSTAFADGGNIPSKFTCDAGQTSPSPALVWKDAPAGTRSFTLVMDDPDVTQIAGGFVHWVLMDIPARTLELPEGFQVGSLGLSGSTGMRRPGYMGPCPPTGVHHYHFKLYALDVDTLGLPQGATRADVEKALAEHKPLAMAETIGLYQKQAK